ncbi:tigger transposable element-derived protein 1-like isoform X3 [Panthera tigris]|uniref:tigger transposable element-derived protein 1-like isoform X3 n=1 Tax=Panthera tigris TaxID=9694 RepID=UPI001C6F7091|nr:tigger transposable element-derived protein 1-like isoform X3 [Panthera tigris]
MRMGNKLGERGDKARNGRRQKQVWRERPRGCPCGHAGSYCGNWQCGEASSRCVAQGGGMKTTSRLQVSGKAPLGGIGLRRSAKRDRKSITLHMKLEVLRRFEEGEKLTQIARALGLATSTVASIRVNKDKIRANSQAATPVSATQLTRCRGVVMGHMERLLSLWIEEQKRQNLPISTLLIQDKARRLFVQLQHEQGSGTQAETFGASNGWFARFKARNNVLLTDEPAVADTQAAAHYPPVLRTILEEGCYSPHQVFNVDETGLFWKRLPERMLLALEGAAGPGLKASKDHLTLLLGGNAAGDFKLKPLLVYPSENPRALKGCSKASLPVVWRSNRNDWLTPSIFQEWFTGCFCPAVESYCASHGLPHRALLLLDGAPCHPAHLGGLSAHVRVEFLPKNTSALIQPMNQGVIATFKAYYLRRTLSQLVQETTGEDRPSVQEFWRSYTVVTAVDNIAEAWAELQPATMNSAWRKLWPECVPAGTPEPDTVPQLRRSIVALARHVGLGDAAEADVASLLQAHGEPPPHSIPQDAKDGDMSGSGLPWETGNGLVSRKQEPDFTEAVVLIENDPNRERSLRVSRGVHCALARLRELHRERRRQSRAAASSGGPVVVAARELAGSLPLPQFVFLSPQTVITGIMGCPPDCRNATWASKPQSASKGRCSCALAG